MTRVGVTGHRGLPHDTKQLIDHALRNVLEDSNDGHLVGISCLADGADQLLARAVLDLGGQLEVVVPAKQYRDNLDLPGEPETYDKLFAMASHVVRLPFDESTEDSHLTAGHHIVDTSHLLIAVWDGQPARGRGGTADIVTHARELGVPVRVIWPQGAKR